MERKRSSYGEFQESEKKKGPLMDLGEQDSTRADKGRSCHVTYPFVNLRTMPDPTSKTLAVIANTSRLILISNRKYKGEYSDYYRVKEIKSGLEGYIVDECLAFDKEEEN